MAKNVKKDANPFLRTTIENWLNNTNELGFQMPFCQALLSKGFSIVHNSKHNASEQGKDIIAVDNKSTPHCYQLKGGNISLKKWRKEVKDEIEELIDLKIEHPSINKKKKHKSYLVTNGELADTVRNAIDNLNSGKWKKNPLKTITGGELLKDFIQISENFIPQEISNYKSFLELYFTNGKELINEKLFTDFIKDTLRLFEANLSKEERKRNIGATVLYTSYIISSFKKENNYISIIQTLSLLISYIFALVEKNDLEDKDWFNSFEIIMNEMILNCKNLENEISNDGLNSINSTVWDGEIAPFRRQLAISYSLTFKVFQIIAKNSKIETSFIEKTIGKTIVYGETALLRFIFMFFYLHHNKQPMSYEYLLFALDKILELNGRKGEAGMLSPYYNISTAVKLHYENNYGLAFLDKILVENFTRRSFFMESLITLLAKHGKRTELESRWREITYIWQESFTPNTLWEHFIWENTAGKENSTFPKNPQSWKELTEQANKIDMESIPKVLQNHSDFLPFFLLVYPHRVNANYIKFLDDLIKRGRELKNHLPLSPKGD